MGLLRKASLFLLLIAPNFAVKLIYKYSRSEPLFYEMIMDSASSFLSPDSGKRELKMKTIIKLKQELIEADADGNLKIAMTVVDAKQEVNGVEKPFPQAANQTQIVRMKENGQVLSTLGQIPGQSAEQNTMQMVFPETDVDAGFMWKQEKDISNPVPIQTQTLYKITEINKGVVRINSIMKLKNNEGDSVQAESKGNTIFDSEQGKIVESEADFKSQFEIPLQIPGLVPDNSKVKVTMHMKMQIREIKLEEDKK